MKLRLFYDYNNKSTLVQLTEQMYVDKFCIPRGFISNGGSIPRVFWRIMQPLDARYIKYYILHDFQYFAGVVSRKQADIQLKDHLQAAGLGKVLSNLIYICVRLFGKSHYLSKTFDI